MTLHLADWMNPSAHDFDPVHSYPDFRKKICIEQKEPASVADICKFQPSNP